ncbi:ATP-binding protein [Aliiglaciecola sp. LCG003]|uniref:hybrid sensor histidine kinase/response regulator n=1 Tax=Aliiglaciecola sp. LCG003 TaxID=3053655 RepID=UPI0025725CF4|nr:ATP-binding protein [Aliiglaciecola sp. LCG003]WJG08177.1 ATP-binding protein [Aliiglaciecola sp. LCG003]
MKPDSVVNSSLSFLSGGGKMGALTRAYDWEATSLGSPENWPQPLKTSLRLLLSTGHPMLIWWGPDLIQFYNDAYSRSLGVERHPSALGQSCRECWGEIWSVIGSQINQVLAGEGHTWHENQLVPITRNGVREDVYWTYSYGPIDDPQSEGGVGGILVVCTETTEQVLAEQRLKTATERWRSLFDQAPGFMCILNGPEYRFEYANKNYIDMIGQQDILGKTVLEVLPEVVNQGFIALLDEVYSMGKTHKGVATPLSLNSQEPLFIDFVYQPTFDEDGQVTGILVQGYDVTKRVRATASLHEADRRKDEFLAMLAHELRNPLAPIRNVSELLTQSVHQDPQLQSIGNILDRQVTQLTHLMDDLLDISRITQNRITLKFEPLNLSKLMVLALESLDNSFELKQQEVSFLDHQEPVFIRGDLTRMVQCLSNVLNNAVKYTPVGGSISVHLTVEGANAIVTITDTGCGIQSDMLSKVFDLFVQAKGSLDRSQGGLGIGLNIVQRMVNMHGGSVTAKSEGLDKGSSFRICLPLIEAPDEDSSCLLAAKQSYVKRILLVDDNCDAADTLAELLSMQGHEVTTVYTAHAALEQIDIVDPSVVLLDIGLPDINGYEVASYIRDKNKERVLIAVTGYGQAEDIRLAKEAGFNFHFTKPVVLNDLVNVFDKTDGDLQSF